MKKKLSLIFALGLIALLLISCARVEVSPKSETGLSVAKTEKSIEKDMTILADTKEEPETTEVIKKEEPSSDTEEAEEETSEEETGTERNLAIPAEENETLPAIKLPEEVHHESKTKEPDKEITECMLTVRCDTILNNLDQLNKSKTSLVPDDGIILPLTKAVFYDGESAFNVLSRELKKNRIHMDFVSAPLYHSVYIKGISNLYEKDCGELSGWLYRVNGDVKSYGCSQYILNDGDLIEFVYTCDLGRDIQ